MSSQVDDPRGADVLLEIRGLSKTFDGTRALDEADFDLRRGEVHALVGQNGSGKSTMIKVLAGFHQPDEDGAISLVGESVEIGDTTVSRDLGIHFVHQELGLVDDLDTVENLALGEGYPTGRGGRIKWSAARREARERLRAFGYEIDVRRPVKELAASERTGVAIARALHDFETAKILVVDEPTASLPSQEVLILFEAIARVKKMGVGVIYVSHRLDEIFQIADRVTVLRDGRSVGTYETKEFDQDRLVSVMVGGVELAASSSRDPRLDAEPVLEVEHLCGEVVEDLSLTAAAGEIVGIAGLTGSGREEILSLLFGALPRTGEVKVDGKRIVTASPAAAVAAGIALVPADRTGEGSIGELTVRENLTLTDLKRFAHAAGKLSKAEELGETKTWIRDLDIRPPRPDAIFSTLSGGNQQKTVFAKWLRTKPRVLLLDEPTQGVDVGAKAAIHAIASRAADEGAAVLIASSDDAELCDTCDRIMIMRDGDFVAKLHGSQMTSELVSKEQLGIAPRVDG